MQERKAGHIVKIVSSTFTKAQEDAIGRKNEDALLTLGDERKFVGFIADGGTALSTLTSTSIEIFDGYFAANAAAEGIKKNFSNKNSAKSLLLAANSEIVNLLKNTGIDVDHTDSEFLPTCGGASLILIDKIRGEAQISQIGDTVVIIVFKNESSVVAIKPSVNYEDAKAYEIARKISESKNVDIRETFYSKEVASTLSLGRHKENLRDGYGALNGKKGARMFIKTKKYKTSEISGIIAVTDGMCPPQLRFNQEPDWKMFANDIRTLGPEKYYEEKVYKEKESDPQLTKYPRFKQYDDASLLEIIFS